MLLANTTLTNSTAILSINSQVMRVILPIEALLFLLFTIVFTIIFIFCFRSTVIKAYGYWFLLFTGFAYCLNYCRYAIFWAVEGQTDIFFEYFRVVIHSVNNCILTWFVLYLLNVQFWRILNIFEANRLQYLINEEKHQSIGENYDTEKIGKLEKRLRLHNYFVSKTFFILAFLFMGSIHTLAFVISLLMLIILPPSYSYIFSSVFVLFACLLFGSLLATIVILILARKIKAPFYIWPVTIIQLAFCLISILINVPILIRSLITVDLYLLIFNLCFVPTSLLALFLGSIPVFIVPLVMEIRHKLQGQQFEKIEEDLIKVVENKRLFKLFQEFCVLEWSSENIVFYMEMRKFRTSDTLDDKEKWLRVERMYKLFFAVDAPMPLNTTSEKLQRVKTAVEHRDWNAIANSLEIIERDVKILMADTYQRFLAYKPYKDHRKTIVLNLSTQKKLGWTIQEEEKVPSPQQ